MISKHQSEIQGEWNSLPLRSLCLKTTMTDPTKNPNLSFEYVDVSSISNELWKITTTTRHTGATAPSRARKLVQSRDVIFATVRPTLKRVALVPNDLDGQIVSTAYCVLRADPTKADPYFIYYALLTNDFIARMENLQRGASYPAVSDSDVLEQEIPVPPLPEQRAIAAVLAKIQAAVEVQDKIVATLNELKAATMAKLFREGLRGEPLKQTKIGEMPESWEVNPLQTLCLKTEIVDPARNPDKSFQYVDVSSVSNDECRIISTTTHNGSTAPSRARKRVMAKDVIFATVRPTLRRVALVSDTVSGHIVSTAFCVLRANPERAVPGFIYYAVLRPEFISLVEGLQRGASYPAVTDGDVLRQLIPVPSIAEQREIVLILSRIHEDEQAARGKRDTLKSLFSSMLHLLMTGQVRVSNLMAKKGGLVLDEVCERRSQ